MSSTQEYEFLLECANVIGVDYDAAADRVTVFVSQKRPKDCLAAEDDVEKRVAEAGDDVEVSVVDSGYGEQREGFDALERRQQHESGTRGALFRLPGYAADSTVCAHSATGIDQQWHHRCQLCPCRRPSQRDLWLVLYRRGYNDHCGCPGAWLQTGIDATP